MNDKKSVGALEQYDLPQPKLNKIRKSRRKRKKGTV
jgi:hypothetical protein